MAPLSRRFSIAAVEQVASDPAFASDELFVMMLVTSGIADYTQTGAGDE